MEFELRKKVLSRLSISTTEKAATALRKELSKIFETLESENEYFILEQQLKLLDTIGFRFSNKSVKVLIGFIQSIESRDLIYSEYGEMSEIKEYNNAETLIVQAAEVLTRLRYLQTIHVLVGLLELSTHQSEVVRNKALGNIKSIADYYINVFHGDERQAGIGAKPQVKVVKYLERLKESDLKKFLPAVLTISEKLLSPTMHSTSWGANTVTFSQGGVPAADDVQGVRHKTIKLLKNLYISVDNLSDKLRIISVLNDVTRTHHTGDVSMEVASMVEHDSLELLSFYLLLIQSEDLPVIQKLEHNSYWIFYHSGSDEIKRAAHEIEKAISDNTEYQIYKTLIGFEGVFGDWVLLKEEDTLWERGDALRKERANGYVTLITSDNFTEWYDRIIKFSETKSNDMATFPVFYYFLERLAESNASLALQLISKASEKVDAFLIPLLRGLWSGQEKEKVKIIIESWAEQGCYLYQSMKLFLNNESLDVDLLSKLLKKADEIDDLNVVVVGMSVAVSNYDRDDRLLIDELFIPGLEILTKHKCSSWVFDFWFRPESKLLISDLDDQVLDVILRNLLFMDKIDYHVEEILYLIAQRDPIKVFSYLIQRLADASEKKESSASFKAIPFSLHKLNEPLSKIPEVVVPAIQQLYDGTNGLFEFRGARLLKIIFQDFGAEFETELLKVVNQGGDENIKFVLSILKNYEGEPFLHHICEEIIKAIPNDSSLRNEMAIVLENTGVVSGEFGSVEAYKRKQNEVKEWLENSDEKVRGFASWYIESLEKRITWEQKRAEEDVLLRKHEYGED